MENKLRYFLTAFFGSLNLFIMIVFVSSLIKGSEWNLIKVIGNILIYYTVPVFILVLACLYLPGCFVRKRYPIFSNVYMQIVQSVVLLVIMLTAWTYFDGLGSRFLRMGFLNYWLRMLQDVGYAVVYFSLAVPILLKFSMRGDR